MVYINFAFLILLFFPVLAFAFCWYEWYHAPCKWKQVLPIYIYSLFVLAYCYTPLETSNADLLRYFQRIDLLREFSLSEAIEFMGDGLYVENFLFWLAARLEMPYLLPALTTSTVFGIGAYITCDLSTEETSAHLWKILLIQFIMIPFFTVANNVRNVFAFSLVILASYRELEKKKRDFWTFALYIAPIFSHKTGIVLLIIRLLIPVFQRAIPLTLGIIVGLPFLIQSSYEHINWWNRSSFLGRTFFKLIRSSYIYLVGDSAYAERVRNSLGAALTRYIVLFFFLLILILFLRMLRRKRRLSSFESMGYLLCVLSLACNVFDTPAYWRFAAAAALAMQPALYSFYRKELFSSRMTSTLKWLLSLYLPIRLGLAIIRLSSINWIGTGTRLMLTNFFSLLATVIRGAARW